MDNRHESKVEPSATTHPGESVREYLDFYGWSPADIANRTDLAVDEIEAICSGTAEISPRAAAAFERVFNRPAHLWSNLQLQFDQAVAHHDRNLPEGLASRHAVRLA